MADALTPRQIVAELDKHIVGQGAAKKAVAVAIRNRWRRQQLPPELRTDVTPKNTWPLCDSTWNDGTTSVFIDG